MTKVKTFIQKCRSLIGDETISIPDDFLINALNWGFNSLPAVPGLEIGFQEHATKQLDANDHYKFELTSKFRRVANIGFLHFYTTTGGDPCKLCVCNRPNRDFYAKNGLVSLKKAGVPCEYTIEREFDHTYVVFDRPLSIPVIADYIVYGFPKPVETMEDEFELSAPLENLLISAIRRMYYLESSDHAFAADITNYLDNKEIVEAVQLLNRYYESEQPVILGGY